ncbi:hypothetical protein [Legionella israelensis]|uniref:hypothetical protein n=1 Tax=Legionella israelensis TaxID=454 RepID=UPI001431962D|nr:hypothetical protein [Legionella israelensis]
MRRKRGNHSPFFKAKVVIAALKRDKSIAELVEQWFQKRWRKIKDFRSSRG